MGQARRSRFSGAKRRNDHRGAACEGAGAEGQGAAPGQCHCQDGQRVFRPGAAHPPTQKLKAHIVSHRDRYGVEPICKVLHIAPSCYCRHAVRQAVRTVHNGEQRMVRRSQRPAKCFVKDSERGNQAIAGFAGLNVMHKAKREPKLP